jgi:hypothetical protein
MPSGFEAVDTKIYRAHKGFHYEEKLPSFCSLEYALHVLHSQKSILFLHSETESDIIYAYTALLHGLCLLVIDGAQLGAAWRNAPLDWR